MAPRNSPELAMVYEQEKQKGNANRATLAVARKMVAYLVAVDRRAKRLSGSRKQKPHRCVAGAKHRRISSARQPARSRQLADWATERKLAEAPSNCFETGRRSQTQSSVAGPAGLRQQMDVWFSIEEEPPPRARTRAEAPKNLMHALL